jgi:uncharacterized protein YgiM (DUF1202 family)
MKKIFILVFIMLATTTLIFLAQASEAGGKCNGSSSCNICTNCTRCQYCKGGGSCGACSTGAERKSSSHTTSNTYSSSNSSSHAKTPGTNTTGNNYFVEPLTLSIRRSPVAGSEILCTLKEFDSVTLIKMHDLKWAQVEVLCSDSTIVSGYTLKSSLIKIEE